MAVHRDRHAGPAGHDGGGPRRSVRADGAPSSRAARVAWRELVQRGDTWRVTSCRRGCACGAPTVRYGWRAVNGQRPATRWMSTRCRRWRPGCRRGGMRTRWTRCRRGDRAWDVEQRGVSAVRGAVDQATAVVSQPAVGRAGPASCLHRRQGLPGPLHGGGTGDRRAGLQARAGTARRGH